MAHVLRSTAVCGAAALLCVQAVTAGQEARARVERSVTVSVVSGSGNTPVAGLATTDFTVREDGVAREVLRVTPAPPPSHLLLLVDDSQAAQDAIQFLRTALKTFVRRMLAGDQAPQIGLMTFGDRPVRRADFSPNSAGTDRAVDRLFASTGSGAYFMEALTEASKDLKKRQAERPVIVAYLDEDGPEFSSLTHKNVATSLREAGVSLWPVTNQGRTQQMGSTEARERALVLGDVTSWSGGTNTIVLTSQAIDNALGSVATQLLSRYLVTYGRPESLVPPDRLELDVKRKDIKVRVTRWAGQ